MGCSSSCPVADDPRPAKAATSTEERAPPGEASWRAFYDTSVAPAVEAGVQAEDINGLVGEWLQQMSSSRAMFPTAESCLLAAQGAEELAKALLEGSCLETEEGYSAASQLAQILGMSREAVANASHRQHVRRVVGGSGWALHGLAFELTDGTRLGQFLENNGQKMDLLGDRDLVRRGGKWKDVRPGERIVKVVGHHCRGGYLAYEVSLVTNTGRQIVYAANHRDWKGSSFEFKAPPGQEVEEVFFDNRGKVTGVRCSPFVDWGGEDEAVREAVQLAAGSVLTALAGASGPKGAREAKYALFQAEMFGLERLECFENLRGAALSGMELPTFWDVQAMKTDRVAEDGGLTFNPADDTNLLAEIELAAEEVAAMQGLFDASFRKRYTRDRRGGKVPDGFRVERGVRVQNALNWAEFAARREAIRTELARLRDTTTVMDSVEDLKTAGPLPADDDRYALDAETNGAWLFHGTNDKAASCITKGDFRVDKAGSNAGTLYGRGVYLAESCSKSDEYSEENEEGLRCMLVCRVTLGSINYCDEKYPDVNRLVRSCVSGSYHSVLGDREKVHNTFREFIVYDDDQVYPEYILWYKRVYN